MLKNTALGHDENNISSVECLSPSSGNEMNYTNTPEALVTIGSSEANRPPVSSARKSPLTHILVHCRLQEDLCVSHQFNQYCLSFGTELKTINVCLYEKSCAMQVLSL